MEALVSTLESILQLIYVRTRPTPTHIHAVILRSRSPRSFQPAKGAQSDLCSLPSVPSARQAGSTLAPLPQCWPQVETNSTIELQLCVLAQREWWPRHQRLITQAAWNSHKQNNLLTSILKAKYFLNSSFGYKFPQTLICFLVLYFLRQGYHVPKLYEVNSVLTCRRITKQLYPLKTIESSKLVGISSNSELRRLPNHANDEDPRSLKWHHMAKPSQCKPNESCSQEG